MQTPQNDNTLMSIVPNSPGLWTPFSDGSELASGPAVPVEAMKAKLSRWLYIGDAEALDMILATAVAIFLKGDPLWTLVVGPSGGGKTELLSIFADSDDAMMLSKLTPHTLLSGLKTVQPGTDLIFQLNDKLLVIKDLAPILESGQDQQREIFSDLRDAYDGRVVKAWGSGKDSAITP